jgi:hypothetical protein
MDVAKVNLDVAYVAMPIHSYFKRMFQVFHLFQTYIAKVSSGCFKSRSGCCMTPMVDGQRMPVTAAEAQAWVNPPGFPMRTWSWTQALALGGIQTRGVGLDVDFPSGRNGASSFLRGASVYCPSICPRALGLGRLRSVYDSLLDSYGPKRKSNLVTPIDQAQ